MKNIGLSLVATLGLSLSACVTINGAPTGVVVDGVNSGKVITQYPVETAILNIYTKQRSEQLRATVNNRNIVADIRVTPKGAMLFNGKQVQGAEFNTTTKSNNQLIDQSVSINYFTLNPLVFYGYTDSSGEYSVATQTTAIPKLAKVGDSSPLITENVYSDSSKRTQIGRYNQSWSLTRNTDTTGLFCIDSSANMLANASSSGTTAECYVINARGDILESRLTINAPNNNGTTTETIRFSSQ